MRLRVLVLVGTFVVLLLALAGPSQATFPGNNGKIAFVRSGGPAPATQDIWTVNPDGTGETNVVDSPYDAGSPSWSPDGNRIAFDYNPCADANCCQDAGNCYEIRSVAADGMDDRLHDQGPFQPAWSPDGRRIAYSVTYGGIGTLNFPANDGAALLWEPADWYFGPDWSPDGTELAWYEYDTSDNCPIEVGNISTRAIEVLVSVARCREPSWSPDGQKIAFTSPVGVETIGRDGANRTLLAAGELPVWSPDGTKIAFIRDVPPGCCAGGDLWVMNADGSGQTKIASDAQSPAWQPIPINSYPRPKGASPLYTSLVVAHTPCTAPNRIHAAPLSYGSCSPAQQSASRLTVGTPDANSQPANATGFVRLGVLPNNPATPADEADVTINVSATDVREQADLSDYAGELRLSTVVRATDKLNTPSPGGPGAATLRDVGLGPSVPCTPTAGTTVGSTCSIATTVDTLIPGVVVGGARSIWETGQVRVFDGGADGDGATVGDNTLFLTQGVFAP